MRIYFKQLNIWPRNLVEVLLNYYLIYYYYYSGVIHDQEIINYIFFGSPLIELMEKGNSWKIQTVTYLLE